MARSTSPMPRFRARTGPWWLAVLVFSAAVVVGPSAAAEPSFAEPKKDPAEQLADLEKRKKGLEKDYRGRIESLEDLKISASRAARRAEQRNRELAVARTQIRALAASSYMQGAPTSLPVLLSTDGSSLKGATMLEYLARNGDRRVQTVAGLALEADRTRRAAQSKVDAVRREIAELESKRGKVRKLLAKYRAENPRRGRPDGVTGKTKSPLVGNYMTPRMREVMLEVDRKFGPFPMIGCYRPGDPQDHGSGRACDFMESTAGTMPTASATAHGDSVARYVVANAARLGIKYVIWRQRIWDARSGGGWRQMEDRGGITQNHMDHPHVSVL
ncbi:MAG: hypothetical protein M0026_00635 [Nocardiopsaceae bacterium]|nr:hypothetical protein [Nocardiopsaceae bacterium]